MVCHLSIFPVYKQIWKHRPLKTIKFLSRKLGPDLPLVGSWRMEGFSSPVDAMIYNQVWRDIPVEEGRKDALREDVLSETRVTCNTWMHCIASCHSL